MLYAKVSYSALPLQPKRNIDTVSSIVHSNVLTADELQERLEEDEQYKTILNNFMKSKFIKSNEFVLSILLIIFASVIFIAEIIIFYKGLLSSSQISKLLLLTFIIFATLFLIAVGFSNDQIAPAMALFGTISGYLLGRTPSTPDKDNDTRNTTNNNNPIGNDPPKKGTLLLIIKDISAYKQIDVNVDNKDYSVDINKGTLLIEELLQGSYKLSIKAVKQDNTSLDRTEEATIEADKMTEAIIAF